MDSFKIHRIHFPFIDSTQKRALALVEDLSGGSQSHLKENFGLDSLGPRDILRISADSQTQGVGQGGLAWHSPPGNISVTYVVPWPDYLRDLALHVPHLVNLALCFTLEAMGFEPKIKWVNDLLLERQKCGGILCQFLLDGKATIYKGPEHYGALVIGVGLNVNMNPEECLRLYERSKDPTKIKFTSLSAVQGRAFDEKAVLEALTQVLIQKLGLLKSKKDFTSLMPEVNIRLAYLGEEVMYFNKGSENPKLGETFILKGLDKNGFARLENKGGKTITVRDGKIRPA